MQEPACYDTYPLATVILANLLPVTIYAIGVYLLYPFGLIWVAGYLLLILALEYRLLHGHCVDCWYYGRTCAFGKGVVSSRLFRKGAPGRFSAMQITWKDIVPDFFLFMIPVFAGILLLIREFSWIVLILVIALLLLGFAGNAVVRGQLACRYLPAAGDRLSC